MKFRIIKKKLPETSYFLVINNILIYQNSNKMLVLSIANNIKEALNLNNTEIIEGT